MCQVGGGALTEIANAPSMLPKMHHPSLPRGKGSSSGFFSLMSRGWINLPVLSNILEGAPAAAMSGGDMAKYFSQRSADGGLVGRAARQEGRHEFLASAAFPLILRDLCVVPQSWLAPAGGIISMGLSQSQKPKARRPTLGGTCKVRTHHTRPVPLTETGCRFLDLFISIVFLSPLGRAYLTGTGLHILSYRQRGLGACFLLKSACLFGVQPPARNK